MFIKKHKYDLQHLFYVLSAINPQTGQADYSQAWAEYYRQQGMHYQANLILQQAAQQPAGAQQPGPNPVQQQ